MSFFNIFFFILFRRRNWKYVGVGNAQLSLTLGAKAKMITLKKASNGAKGSLDGHLAHAICRLHKLYLTNLPYTYSPLEINKLIDTRNDQPGYYSDRIKKSSSDCINYLLNDKIVRRTINPFNV
jgi:hypothetical protein